MEGLSPVNLIDIIGKRVTFNKEESPSGTDAVIGDVVTRLQRLEVESAESKSTSTTTTIRSSGDEVWLSSAVTIESATTSAVSWTTFNASSHIPAGATFAILEVSGGNDSADDCVVNARKDSASMEFQIHRGYAGGGAGDDVGSSVQVRVPITTARTFDYEIPFGYSYDLTIKLIGYKT